MRHSPGRLQVDLGFPFPSQAPPLRGLCVLLPPDPPSHPSEPPSGRLLLFLALPPPTPRGQKRRPLKMMQIGSRAVVCHFKKAFSGPCWLPEGSSGS